MSEKKFKRGDKVKCINIGNNDPGIVTLNKIYDVLDADENFVTFINDSGDSDIFGNRFFELICVTEGIKFDQNKAPMDLIPYESLEEIAKVLAAGEKKYGTANWASGIEMRRLLSAALRHIGQFNSGEDFDSETNTLHLANAATNLLFAIWMYKNRPDLDNRWIKTIDKK